MAGTSVMYVKGFYARNKTTFENYVLGQKTFGSSFSLKGFFDGGEEGSYNLASLTIANLPEYTFPGTQGANQNVSFLCIVDQFSHIVT